MGTLFSALDIARSGLQVAQLQLDITAHNIANVNTPGFSRQRVDLTTHMPNFRPYGAIGRGPVIAGIDRLRNTFLDGVYREEVGALGFATERAKYYEQIEDIFLEPNENGMAVRFGQFFDAMNDFAVNVESFPARVALVAEGEAVAGALREISRRVHVLRANANEEVRALVPEINAIASQIADSNLVIARAEGTGKAANDLRDRRDVLIDNLARLVNITVQERDDGTVDVLLGGEELVLGRVFRTLEAVPDATIDPTRPEFLAVRFADNAQPATILDGELASAIRMRDVDLRDLRDRMDTLAAGLIENVNRIQSQGVGLQAFGAPLTSSNGVSNPAVALDSAGLPFTVSDGGFQVVAYDAGGNIVETVTVPVTAAATTLDDVAAAINASANLSASIDAAGALTVTPNAGITFAFANDTANLLPALGMNGFFTGTGAGNIAVSTHVVENPATISSRYDTDPLNAGDNSAALDFAALRNASVMSGGAETLNQFFESMIVRIGVEARTNGNDLTVQATFVGDVDRRRQEVHGVNLDEEVTSLILFQRAYEASARIVTVADRMLETLLNLVR